MDNSTEKIIALLNQPQWNDEDIEWILNYSFTTDGNKELRELLQDRLIIRMQQERAGHSARAMERLNELHAKMETSGEPQIATHRVRYLKTAWIRYAAAIIIIAGIGLYVYINNQKEKTAVTQTNPVPVQNDVAPGGNKATLILADGSKIILDSAANGTIAQQENATITKNGDQIVYASRLTPDASRISYNTMATPRGGQYKLTLPDGSQVWLNAESGITYPTTFGESERERRVSVTGEVYFEVAKNKAKPFIVSISSAGGGVREVNGGGLDIEVLGTHFNINAYKDESTINTTLLEGSVKLITLPSQSSRPTNAVHTSLILKPGQQGQLTKEKLSLAVNPNLEQVMAWKNGTFYFQSEDLPSIMKQMARWYDLEVEYAGEIPQRTFSGEIDRNLTLTQVLNVLTQTRIKYRIQGNKITILP